MDDLCSYVGMIPKMYGSGERMVTGKLSKRGRKDIKIMLIEAAWVAVRKDPALTARFNKLSLRMNRNKAIIRIAKNLLGTLRQVFIGILFFSIYFIHFKFEKYPPKSKESESALVFYLLNQTINPNP
jgi:hypothetical protein